MNVFGCASVMVKMQIEVCERGLYPLLQPVEGEWLGD